MAYGNCLLKRQVNVYCTTICHDCFEILIVFIFPNAHFIIYLADDLQSRSAIKPQRKRRLQSTMTVFTYLYKSNRG